MSKERSDNKPLPTDSTAVESVDKIREIIFGSNMQEYEARFKQLEDRLTKEMTRVTSESSEQLSKVQKTLVSDVEALRNDLGAEEGARQSLDHSVSHDLAQIQQQLQNQVGDTEAEFNQQLVALRKQLDEQVAGLQSTLDDMNKRLEAKLEQLGQQKASRKQLADGLMALAQQIHDED